MLKERLPNITTPNGMRGNQLPLFMLAYGLIYMNLPYQFDLKRVLLSSVGQLITIYRRGKSDQEVVPTEIWYAFLEIHIDDGMLSVRSGFKVFEEYGKLDLINVVIDRWGQDAIGDFNLKTLLVWI